MSKKNDPRVSIELKPSRIAAGEVGAFAIYGFEKGEKFFTPIYYGPGVFLTWNEVG